MPPMQVYQRGVSIPAEADLHTHHYALPQNLAKLAQQLAFQIRQLRRPSRLGDPHDEHPGRQPDGPGLCLPSSHRYRRSDIS